MREQLGIIEASAWANVKFPFHVIMSLLRYRKMSYRGVEKSEAQPFEPANPGLACGRLPASDARNPFGAVQAKCAVKMLSPSRLRYLVGAFGGGGARSLLEALPSAAEAHLIRVFRKMNAASPRRLFGSGP